MADSERASLARKDRLLKEAQEALRPFAEQLANLPRGARAPTQLVSHDAWYDSHGLTIMVRHLRRAAFVLKKIGEEKDNGR
jgi:hypothetical protein